MSETAAFGAKDVVQIGEQQYLLSPLSIGMILDFGRIIYRQHLSFIVEGAAKSGIAVSILEKNIQDLAAQFEDSPSLATFNTYSTDPEGIALIFFLRAQQDHPELTLEQVKALPFVSLGAAIADIVSMGEDERLGSAAAEIGPKDGEAKDPPPKPTGDESETSSKPSTTN